MKSYRESKENGKDKVSPFAAFIALCAVCLFTLAVSGVSAAPANSVQKQALYFGSLERAVIAQAVTPTTGTTEGTEGQPLPLPTPTIPSNLLPSDAAPPGEIGSQVTPGLPSGQLTGIANPVITGITISPVDTSGPTNPNVVDPGAQPPTNQPSTPSQDGGFPWLPVALIALAALVGGYFAVTRGKPAVSATATPAGTSPVMSADTAAARIASESSTEETTSLLAPSETTADSSRAAATTPISVATTPISATAASAAQTEVICPNCGTSNSYDENFCHECGQDLRGARPLVTGAAVPPVAPTAEPDIDTLPYLETLDRVDEQLEYVLSRPRVLVGAAPGNDIVVNTDFKGYRTVSPVHAELRRDEIGYVLRDRESERGTYVNDSRIGESVLKDGDTLRVGDVRFVFHIPSQ